MPLGVC